MPLSSDVPMTPSTIGPFRVVKELGLGGTSTVYLGERVGSFSQRVAIKVLHAIHPASAAESEQRLLSSLEHANIVRLLDQGLSEQGRRYLVMEFVDGLPIDRFCDARKLTIAARIPLLVEAMAGVGYAHRHMVVHADIKPTNILVDAAGEPKLLDFGIAAMLGSEAAAREEETPLFTPAFASPEQKLGAPVSVASDVYSLGVVAAILLTGLGPEAGVTASERLGRADRRQVEGIAEARSTTRSTLLRTVAGDLEAILDKALHPSPEMRYGTVAAFSDDLTNYLGGWPISAIPATTAVKVRKWVRRHLLVASLTAVALLTIGFSVVGVTVQTARAAHQRRVTETQLEDLVRLTGELDGELFDSARPLAASDTARKTLLQGATKTLDQLAADDGGDPQVAAGVAQQYARLARSWISLGDAAGAQQAGADVDRALALLDRLPPSAAVVAQRSELLRLKDSLKK